MSVMDHVWQIGGIGPPEHPMLEAYTTLGLPRGGHRRVDLLALVTAVVYREPACSPRWSRRSTCCPGGRAGLGIGAAWNEDEARGLGLLFPPLARALRAAGGGGAASARQMWSDDDAPFEGKHYQLDRTLNSPQR